MIRKLIPCLAIAVLTMISPESARAAEGDVIAYDTVDAIEVISNDIVVTGIISGQGSPTTRRYDVFGRNSSDVSASRCDRLALLAMSKPGKFQFAVVVESTSFRCKLILRTP